MAVTTIVALVIATLIPLAFLYGIYAQDLYGTGALKTVLICLAWGGFAVYLAAYTNTYLKDYLNYTLADTSRYIAPISEEILKALFLFYLVKQPRFTYFVDGAIYGFAAGMGFAVIENYLYLNALGPDAALGTAISRVISTNLMHATASGIVGIALGISRFEKGFKKYLHLVGGLLLAMILHAIFNYFTNHVEFAKYILLIAGGIGLAGLGSIAYIMKIGLAEQKSWIQEKLGIADRVSSNEARVVQRLEDIHEILEPLIPILGEEQVDIIESFLTLQAQLGIKRKTLDKLPDEKMKKGVEAEMDGIRKKMEDARLLVGRDSMFYVRTLFPDGEIDVDSVLTERMASLPRDTSKPDMFSRLGSAMGSEEKDPFAKLGKSMEPTKQTNEQTTTTPANNPPKAANPFAKLGKSMEPAEQTSEQTTTTPANNPPKAANPFAKLGKSMEPTEQTSEKTTTTPANNPPKATNPFAKLGKSMDKKEEKD